jgi:glycosyltransferase involved in cell wall biosynthesis
MVYMKRALFVAYRNDPRKMESGSGAEYQFLRALKRIGFEVEIIGPFQSRMSILERGIRKFHRLIFGRRYLRFPVSTSIFCSRYVEQHIEGSDELYDLIFCHYPSILSAFRSSAPVVFRVDSPVAAWQKECRELGRGLARVAFLQEHLSIRMSAGVISHSDWAVRSLVADYGLDQSKVKMFPNPAALPESVVPTAEHVGEIRTTVGRPLRLLFVGRDPIRKGLAMAKEVCHQLNLLGLPSHLTVVGLNGDDTEQCSFVGYLNKSQRTELVKYVDILLKHDLLLHPAQFDPSPIATSEAAAFGMPVVTNSSGGLSTSVKNGISGIVLQREATASEYARAIVDLTAETSQFSDLCLKARARFESELNWTTAQEELRKALCGWLN